MGRGERLFGNNIIIYKATLGVGCGHSQLATFAHLTKPFAYGAQEGSSCKNAAARIESLACVHKEQMHSPPSVIHSKRRAEKPWPFHPRSTDLISVCSTLTERVMFGAREWSQAWGSGRMSVSQEALQLPISESLGGEGAC